MSGLSVEVAPLVRAPGPGSPAGVLYTGVLRWLVGAIAEVVVARLGVPEEGESFEFRGAQHPRAAVGGGRVARLRGAGVAVGECVACRRPARGPGAARGGGTGTGSGGAGRNFGRGVGVGGCAARCADTGVSGSAAPLTTRDGVIPLADRMPVAGAVAVAGVVPVGGSGVRCRRRLSDITRCHQRSRGLGSGHRIGSSSGSAPGCGAVRSSPVGHTVHAFRSRRPPRGAHSPWWWTLPPVPGRHQHFLLGLRGRHLVTTGLGAG